MRIYIDREPIREEITKIRAELSGSFGLLDLIVHSLFMIPFIPFGLVWLVNKSIRIELISEDKNRC